MPDKQKSNDYKTVAVEYFLVEDTTQEEVCKIFKCSRRSLMRWYAEKKVVCYVVEPQCSVARSL